MTVTHPDPAFARDTCAAGSGEGTAGHMAVTNVTRELRRHLRRLPCGRWRARPVRGDRRYDLGRYDTVDAAREAVAAFLACADLLAHPRLRSRFVSKIRDVGGAGFVVRLPDGRVERFPTRFDAELFALAALELTEAELYSSPVDQRSLADVG